MFGLHRRNQVTFHLICIVLVGHRDLNEHNVPRFIAAYKPKSSLAPRLQVSWCEIKGAQVQRLAGKLLSFREGLMSLVALEIQASVTPPRSQPRARTSGTSSRQRQRVLKLPVDHDQNAASALAPSYVADIGGDEQSMWYSSDRHLIDASIPEVYTLTVPAFHRATGSLVGKRLGLEGNSVKGRGIPRTRGRVRQNVSTWESMDRDTESEFWVMDDTKWRYPHLWFRAFQVHLRREKKTEPGVYYIDVATIYLGRGFSCSCREFNKEHKLDCIHIFVLKVKYYQLEYNAVELLNGRLYHKPIRSTPTKNILYNHCLMPFEAKYLQDPPQSVVDHQASPPAPSIHC